MILRNTYDWPGGIATICRVSEHDGYSVTVVTRDGVVHSMGEFASLTEAILWAVGKCTVQP